MAFARSVFEPVSNLPGQAVCRHLPLSVGLLTTRTPAVSPVDSSCAVRMAANVAGAPAR